MVNDPNPDALRGKVLLKKVKELEHLSREEKAKTCGYYTVTKKGVTRVNMMKFLNALIEAEGIQIDSTHSGNGRGGRSASYRITVQSNGNLLIGSAYTKQMGLNPGDEFEISLGRKHIRLTQLGNGDDIALDADDDVDDIEEEM
jgi:AbrB-like transcriptional regulator